MITAEQFLLVCGFGAFWGAMVVGISYLIGKFIGVVCVFISTLLREKYK